MFERYTEKARRVIFFARYEASAFGSSYIETEHFLLGLLREDKALCHRFLRTPDATESIRTNIEQHSLKRKPVSTSVDLPLSNECKRILAYSAEEAEGLSDKHIGTEHMLLGLLREEKSFAAALLHERGLRLPHVREELRKPRQPDMDSIKTTSVLLLESEQRLVEAANKRDADEMESFYCDDAMLILPKQPLVKGKQEIHAWVERLAANRNVKFSYQNIQTDVSNDGSLGYTTSEYEVEILRNDGSIFQEKGRWVQVWRGEHGQWRIAIEIASAVSV